MMKLEFISIVEKKEPINSFYFIGQVNKLFFINKIINFLSI